MLIQLLTDEKLTAETRTQRQSLLNWMGASHVALMLAASQDVSLCRAGLQLGQGLLDGGNPDVQAAMYTCLTSAAVSAYDGSRAGFLEMMRHRLRLAAKEVRRPAAAARRHAHLH